MLFQEVSFNVLLVSDVSLPPEWFWVSHALSVHNIPRYILIFVVVPLYLQWLHFWEGKYWQALRVLMSHTLVSLFFIYLFFNFVYDVWGSHRRVAYSGLLGYDSMFELVQFTILHVIVSQKTWILYLCLWDKIVWLHCVSQYNICYSTPNKHEIWWTWVCQESTRCVMQGSSVR